MTRSIPLVEVKNLQQTIIDDDDAIDLRHYLYVLSKYTWSILGLTIVISLLTTLIVFSIEPTYRATATVLIESQEQNVVSIEEVYGLQGANDEYFETQNQILKSRELSERVIDKLNIAKHPEFDPTIEKTGFDLNPMSWIPKDWLPENPPLSTHGIRNLIYSKFSEQLTVTPIRNSQLINISFDAHDARLSANVPNILVQVYIESNLEARLAMTQQAAGWITERLGGLRKKVEESEHALQAYRDKERLVDVKGVDSLAAKELDELTEELVEARRNRTEAEEKFRQVNILKGKAIDAFASIPAVLEDPNVQQSKAVEAEAQRKLSEFAKRYGAKHPKMISAVAEFKTADKNLNKQIRNVINSVEKHYQVARARERALSRAMNSTKGEMVEINRVAYKLSTLERDIESNQNLYDMFLTRFKETNIAGDSQAANARLADPAVLPTKSVKPKKLLIILISLFLSITAGVVIAFLIESLDNTLKDVGDVELKLHMPVLGILPKLSFWTNRDLKTLRYYSDNKETSFAEHIRTIRTGVLLTDIDEKKKSFLVTSSAPNEGKSVLAVNLALAMAQLGKTLIIDCDMRRPSILNIFAMKSHNPGLSNYISGTHKLGDCIQHFTEEDLYVMPAGVIPPNPLEMLSSEKFVKGIELLKSEFDYVILDSAPVIVVSDPLVMSNLVNKVIYVVKADNTPYQSANEGIKRLRLVGATIGGVVLNQVCPSKHSNRYGYYYGNYNDYYGYKES